MGTIPYPYCRELSIKECSQKRKMAALFRDELVLGVCGEAPKPPPQAVLWPAEYRPRAGLIAWHGGGRRS